ncbi:MAG: ATP-binding cassette domain-containing protein [Magnetospirillum sp.]|nr:ATP-binding cassette domain-containing protein [Magnetospirillum sp.]
MGGFVTTSPHCLRTRGVLLDRDGRVFARLPDVDLAPGRIVALTGTSGAGKTTALLALAGIRPPREGSIQVGDTDLWSLPPSGRDRLRGQRIGLVFQSFHLIDAVSVEENLRLAASCAGLRAEPGHLQTLLETLDIVAIRHRRADRLSQGQAQRVAVARALVNRPALVLADEPTSALDDGNARALLDLLARVVREQGAGLLIATHDRRALDAVDASLAMEAAG